MHDETIVETCIGDGGGGRGRGRGRGCLRVVNRNPICKLNN